MDELFIHFGNLCDKDIINKLMSEADIDKDGKISLDDFMKMMQKYIDGRAKKMRKIAI